MKRIVALLLVAVVAVLVRAAPVSGATVGTEALALAGAPGCSGPPSDEQDNLGLPSSFASADLTAVYCDGTPLAHSTALATANLVTGKLGVKVTVDPMMFGVGSAQAKATIVDGLHFHVPPAFAFLNDVELKITVKRSAFLGINTMAQYCDRLFSYRSFSCIDLAPPAADINVFTRKFGLARNMTDFQFTAYLQADTASTGALGRMEADFSNTATLELILPPGVTFTSDSGVFLSPPPTLKLQLNATTLHSGDTMILTATLTPGTSSILVDAYIVLQLPDGTLFSLQIGGAMPGIAPIVKNFIPPSFTGEVVRYTLTGREPPGTYSWFAALTQAGTLNLVGDVQQNTFAFSR